MAIADDLGAIVIIAIFYTADLSVTMLLFAGFAIALLIALNLFKVTRIAPYMVIGVILWAFVLKSGVHATLCQPCTAPALSSGLRYGVIPHCTTCGPLGGGASCFFSRAANTDKTSATLTEQGGQSPEMDRELRVPADRA